MSRLPVVYSDVSQWGTILNEFLRVAHNDDGTLKATNLDGFPSGTVMLFRQSAPPATWTRVLDVAKTDSAIIVRTNGEVVGSGGSWTVSGLTNNAPALVMDAYTPAGVVSQPLFVGNAMAAHQHDIPINLSGGVDLVYQAVPPFGTGANITADEVSGGGAGPGGVGAMMRSSSVAAGTPTGTVSQPVLTGTPAVLTGTVAAPVITSGGAWRPKFFDVIAATKN